MKKASRNRDGNGKILLGQVKRHPDGFGFFIPADRTHSDVYLPRHTMGGVMTNDTVEVEVFPSHKDDRFFGEIRKIVGRATKTVVGRLHWINEREALLLDDSKSWGANLKVLKEFSMGAKEGDFVAVEITAYPTPRGDFSGRVSSILGNLEDPLNDTKRVIASHQLPEGFSKAALAQAQQWGSEVRPQDIQGRVDLRHLPLVTIDGATAKDFDDAIYVKMTSEGFTVYVGIADVSHYVAEGTTLDDEAYQKGNSTYFPNYVIPMLPESLSNVLCSLNPNVDRLAMVAEMKVSFQGELGESKFYEAVIKSHARITYGEAQEVFDGKTPENLMPLEKEIKLAGDLAKILMARRFAQGSLDLELPATEVLLNSDGVPTDVVRSERLFAHRVIEEMMLLANVAVAEFLTRKGSPSLYRIHEEPNPDSLEILQKYLFNFGGKGKVTGGKIQKKLTRALQEFSGRPEAQILNILTLRSMSQARYSAENVGHFGLGFENYTHFTSPIRRYSDLVVHRLLKAHLYPQKGFKHLSQDRLQTIANWISACEQRSVKAERALISIKKARFLAGFLGQEFDGIISSVAKFGIFVLLRTYDVDGLVKIEDLGDDKFLFDEDNLVLVGKKTGQTYRIGDFVRVQVAAVNVEEGKVDFILVSEENQNESDHQPQTDRKNDQKRRKNKKNRRRLR